MYMRLALALARKGENRVSPNPRVGAVIVKSGKIIGRGYHKYFGGPHAEVYAIRNARAPVKGATVYVNLEPCNIYGKTPPCTDLLIRSGVRDVVIGATDPNPLVAGKGMRQLRRAGISVRKGILRKECEELNESFAKFILKNIPFVTLKIAQTLDGRIADTDGRSRWISGPEARAMVQTLRGESDAILIGAGTVTADDPRLTVRSPGARNPLRIILDGKFRSPAQARVFKNQETAKTIILTDARFLRTSAEKKKRLEKNGVAIFPFMTKKPGIIPAPEIVRFLGSLGIKSLLVEGGSDIFSHFLETGVADKIICFTSGVILGNGMNTLNFSSPRRLNHPVRLEQREVRQIGDDILTTGYPHKSKA
jgi:diaminohydroxyphosphoribosylaminopyrimidine deaminase/5-amino-6-(5-phosphoribosylamino)uracil reductase